MIFSRVDILVPYGAVGVYTPTATFMLPRGQEAEKLSFNAKDADVILQVRETGSNTFNPAVETEEQDGPRGFSSFVYVTAISGVRFRAKNVGTSTRLSFTLYG